MRTRIDDSGRATAGPSSVLLRGNHAHAVLAAILLCCATILTAPGLGSSHLAVRAAPRSLAPQPELYYGFTYSDAPAVPTVQGIEQQTGKGASLVMWYQAWQLQGQPQPFPTAGMEAVREHGAIPMLAWEPDNYPQGDSDPAFSLSKIIGGAYDPYLRQYAAAARAWGHPFFLRFAAEMNGNWTLWSEAINGNSKGQFVAAWKHVHDLFRAAGATNATWVWCPNVENAYTTPLEDLYPGPAYVDWGCMDGYNYSILFNGTPWRSFSQVFQKTYQHLLRLLPPTMPIIIGETGSVEQGGSKPAWITDTFTTELPARFPRIKGLIWFDIAKGGFDLRVDTSAQSLTAFRQAIASPVYQTDKYSLLDQSPIPSPEQFVPPTPTPTPAAPLFGLPTTIPTPPSNLRQALVPLLLGVSIVVLVVAWGSAAAASRRRRAARHAKRYRRANEERSRR